MFRAIALTAVLFAAGTASAQPARHVAVPVPRIASANQSEQALDVLLAKFDAARARRDRQEIRRIEERVKQILRSELLETRPEARRYGNRAIDDVQQARRILRELEQLQGRFARRALAAKRELLAQAARLDLDDRPERYGEGRRGPRGNR